jgi:acyl-CoA thioester hydrolase
MSRQIQPGLDQVTQLPITHQETVIPDYLDEMGHMNVQYYTKMFDRAIDGVFRMIGFNPEYMEQNQAGSFALEAHSCYLAEARVDHLVVVHSRFLARTPKRFQMMHFMINETRGRLAATLEVVAAHIDMTDRRMSAFPEEMAGKIEHYVKEHQSLDWEAPLCGVMRP